MQPHHRPISLKYAINEDQLLGKGSTGDVYLGYQLQPPHQKVAVKAIDLRNVDNQVTKYLLGCQITALSTLSKVELPGHDHIVKLLEVAPQGNHIYLVMQLLEGGTLTDYLKKYPKGLPEDQAITLMLQILQGYLLMSSKNIVHRDLKPDNILFQSKPELSKRLSIIDFGYCQMEQVANKPQLFYNVGSPKYMSPQAYKQCVYSQKSDVWALGVVLYLMMTGHTLDEGHSMDTYLQMLKSRGIPMPGNLSNFAKHLLSGMLTFQSSNRFSCLHTVKEIKNYLRAKNMLPIQQKRCEVRSKTKQNIVFRSTMIDQSPWTNKNDKQLYLSMLPPNDNVMRSEQPHQEDKVGKALRRSRSANNVTLTTLYNFNQVEHKPLDRIDNTTKNSQIQPPRANHPNIRLQYHPSQKQKPSPQQVVVRSPSPKQKINFKFVNQPQKANNNPKPIISPTKNNPQQRKQTRIPSNPNNGDQNKIRIHVNQGALQRVYFPQELDKIVLVDQRPGNEVSPQESINYFQRTNERIYTDKKLIGGCTLEETNPSTRKQVPVRRVQRFPMAHQFVCRQDVRAPYLRQISLPKTIHH